MILIIIVHLDGASLGLPRPPLDASLLAAGDWWRLSVESLTIVGVNCFTLISGYFAIRARWRGLLAFTLECLFYSVLIYLVMVASGRAGFSISAFADVCRVFTRTDLWYVPAYLGLYLLSPFLNGGFAVMSRRQATTATIAFVVFNVWAGWWGNGSFNPTGYTLTQLVMVYLMGRCMSLYNLRRVPRDLALAMFLACAAVTVVMSLYLPTTVAFAYNSPVILVQSVALFVFFSSFDFTSRRVNILARGSFAAYLIHKNPYVWISFVAPMSLRLWQVMPLPVFSVWIVMAGMAIFVVSSMIDQVRIALFNRLKL